MVAADLSCLGERDGAQLIVESAQIVGAPIKDLSGIVFPILAHLRGQAHPIEHICLVIGFWSLANYGSKREL